MIEKPGDFMSDNPLKQYFRRPAVYIKLPSNGEGYPIDAVDIPENGEIPIYPMTAIDEITSRTPDALFNGTAVIELIRSCVPNIKDPWKINNIDLDPILIAIRAATFGSTMEVETTCPSCNEEAKYDADLTRIMSQFTAGDYKTPLKIGPVQIKFSPMPFTEINKAGLAQFEMQKIMQIITNLEDEEERNHKTSEAMKKLNDTYIDLITNMINFIKTPEATVLEKNYIREFLINCDKKTYDTIRDHSVALRQSSEIKPLQIKCMHCGHEYEQLFTVNITDFFE